MITKIHIRVWTEWEQNSFPGDVETNTERFAIINEALESGGHIVGQYRATNRTGETIEEVFILYTPDKKERKPRIASTQSYIGS